MSAKAPTSPASSGASASVGDAASNVSESAASAHGLSLAGKLWYETVYFSSLWGFTLGYSFRAEGSANIPRQGPVLLVANHQSYLDPPAIGLAVGRPLVYLARKTLFRNRFFKGLIESLGAVPIDQEGVGKEGLKTVLAELDKQRAVLVFPEGTRTETGEMNELRPGIHLLLKRAKVPIVPIGIAGAYYAWPIHRKAPTIAPLFFPAREGTMAVSIGRPLDASRYSGWSREDTLADLHREIHSCFQRAEKLRRK